VATESDTELRLAIGRHDDLLERVAKMLSYAKQSGAIPRHLLLAEEELKALDEFLVSVAAGLTKVPNLPESTWMPPVRFAYRTGYCREGQWTWLEALHRGLTQSRAFFASLEPRRQPDGSVTYNVGTAGVFVVGAGAHVHNVEVTQDFSSHVTQINLPLLADELARLRAAMRADAKTLEQDAAVGAVADAEIAARAGDRPRALERLKAAGKWALDVAMKIGVEIATSALKVQLGLPK
jgi:hypothetical protein